MASSQFLGDERRGGRRAALGQTPALRPRTFGEWADEWLAGTVPLKARTVAGYEPILKAHVLPAFKDMPIGAIDQADVRRFVAEVSAKPKNPQKPAAGTLGAWTARNAYHVVRAVFRVAIGSGAVWATPCVAPPLRAPPAVARRGIDRWPRGHLPSYTCGRSADEAHRQSGCAPPARGHFWPLSRGNVWSGCRDLNPGPSVPQTEPAGRALPRHSGENRG